MACLTMQFVNDAEPMGFQHVKKKLLSYMNNKRNVPVVQLDRILDYDSSGCGFDSCPGRHL